MVVCTQCGSALSAQDLTCPQCGHSRVDRVRSTPPIPQRPEPEPGVPESHPPSRPTGTYQSPLTRARWAQGLIFLVSLTAVYGMWATWEEIQLLERILSDQFITFEEAAASDARVSTAGLLYLVAMLAAVVVYLMWMHRAVANLDEVRTGFPTEPLRFSPGWAVGWYFVPIMNLFRPFQVMRELYRESNPVHVSSPLIASWWTLWIIASVLGPGVTGLFTDQTTQAAIFSDWRIIVSNVVLVADAALIYVIIDRITGWQDDRAHERGLA